MQAIDPYLTKPFGLARKGAFLGRLAQGVSQPPWSWRAAGGAVLVSFAGFLGLPKVCEVADGEDVRMTFRQESLVVTFTDWHKKTVSFVCDDTVAFRWQEGEYLLDPADARRPDAEAWQLNCYNRTICVEQQRTWLSSAVFQNPARVIRYFSLLKNGQAG